MIFLFKILNFSKVYNEDYEYYFFNVLRYERYILIKSGRKSKSKWYVNN